MASAKRVSFLHFLYCCFLALTFFFCFCSEVVDDADAEQAAKENLLYGFHFLI